MTTRSSNSPRTQRELAIVVGRFLLRNGYNIGCLPGQSYQVFPGIHVYKDEVCEEQLLIVFEWPKPTNYLVSYVHIPSDDLLFDVRTPIMLRLSELADNMALQVLAGEIKRFLGREVIVFDPRNMAAIEKVDQNDRLDDRPRTE